jgi:hypothetical protein
MGFEMKTASECQFVMFPEQVLRLNFFGQE